MMNLLAMILRLLGGLALGILFYTGLWLTVRRLPLTHHPVALTLASFWIRTLVMILGLVWVMHGRWEYALFCLAGVLIARMAVSRTVLAVDGGEHADHSR